MVEVNIHDLGDGCNLEPKLSVRNKTGRELVIFGQDEAIFRTTHLNTNVWYIDGQASLRSKGMGVGVMVSSFNSYQFGFGMKITNEQLTSVNTHRNGQNYVEEAATFLNGSAAKPPLSESPFLRLLEHGQGKDGYWTYNHMVLQLEDVIDCMTVLYPDPEKNRRCQFDLAFELDHSSGHAKDRVDGLSAVPSILNTSYGGSQRFMRETELTEGCFGSVKHERVLKVGDKQSMVFTDTDLPPITDPECPKYDRPLGIFSQKNMTVPELKAALAKNDLNSDGDRKRLIDRCNAAGIATVKQIEKIKAGYVGKQKGALQIAFERGFCDKEMMLNGQKISAHGRELDNKYTEKFITKPMLVDEIRQLLVAQNLPTTGNRTELLARCALHKLSTNKKVQEKARDTKTSVYHFLEGCDDFKAEKSQMQYVLEELLNVELRMTPKCHPEIAGQGIEYAWGYAKLRFRQKFNDMTAANLKENVRAVLDTEVLTRKRTNKFVRKARDYKLTYLFLLQQTSKIVVDAATTKTEGRNHSNAHERI